MRGVSLKGVSLRSVSSCEGVSEGVSLGCVLGVSARVCLRSVSVRVHLWGVSHEDISVGVSLRWWVREM